MMLGKILWPPLFFLLMPLALVQCKAQPQSVPIPPPVIIQDHPAPVIAASPVAKHLPRGQKQQLLNELNDLNDRVEAMRQRLNKLNK